MMEERGWNGVCISMHYVRITENLFAALKRLHTGYKEEIGEDAPGEAEFKRLLGAMTEGQIMFYGCMVDGVLVACCSITPTFSTYDYQRGGVFEDFYIVPEYRHRGIARELIRYAYRESCVSTLTVGCADCDKDMYQALGFRVLLGNMYAYEA